MSEKWEATGSPVSEAIARERETRHWTIGQRREALGESWPGESARITHEADEAVDELLRENDEYEQLANSMLDALLLIQSNERGESYSAGVAMSCIASMEERRKAYGRRGKVPRFLPTWLGGEADRISGPGVALTTATAPQSPPASPDVAPFDDAAGGRVTAGHDTQLGPEEALEAINALRSNVIATQSAGWSNLVYPLVAILDAAGYELSTPPPERIDEHLSAYGGAGGYPGQVRRG